MNRGFDEKYIEVLFERQRALLALTFEQNLNELLLMQKTFMQNVFDYAKSAVPPPRLPPLPPSEDSSGSIRVADEISNSPASSEASSFIEESDSDPKVYSAKIMDDWFIDKDLPEKRNRKKRTIWSPNDHEGEKADNGEDLGSDIPSSTDVRRFKQFIVDANKSGVDYALLNVWYQKTWGRQLDGIRDNLGRDGQNKECKELFDTIIKKAFEGEKLSILSSGYTGMDICKLCNMKKRCTKQVDGHLLAICCAQLANALIEFFGFLSTLKGNDWTSNLIDANKLFEKVLIAHGEKGNKKRWKKQ